MTVCFLHFVLTDQHVVQVEQSVSYVCLCFTVLLITLEQNDL